MSGIDSLGSGIIGKLIPPLTRRPLKTLKKKRVKTPVQSTGQMDVGAPKVDTFARDTVPNVTYTLKPR
jgi:hypothetical protein